MLILVRHSRVGALVCAQFADCTNFSCASVFKLTKFTKWSTEEKRFSLYTFKKHFCYPQLLELYAISPAFRFYVIQPQIIRLFHVAIISGVIIFLVQVIEIQLCKNSSLKLSGQTQVMPVSFVSHSF